MGQVLIALDADSLSGDGFGARMSDLLAAMGSESGVRIPGDRRLASRARAEAQGVNVPAALHSTLIGLAEQAEATR